MSMEGRVSYSGGVRIFQPGNGSWATRSPSTAALDALLRANGF